MNNQNTALRIKEFKEKVKRIKMLRQAGQLNNSYHMLVYHAVKNRKNSEAFIINLIDSATPSRDKKVAKKIRDNLKHHHKRSLDLKGSEFAAFLSSIKAACKPLKPYIKTLYRLQTCIGYFKHTLIKAA